jgi:hypothetical protein
VFEDCVSLDCERLKSVGLDLHKACIMSALLLMLFEGGRIRSALIDLLVCEIK